MKFKFFIVFSLCMLLITINFKNKKDIPDLVLENVEALTSEEVSEATKSNICYNSVTYDENESRVSVIYYCGSCSEVPYTSYKDQGICKIKR